MVLKLCRAAVMVLLLNYIKGVVFRISNVLTFDISMFFTFSDAISGQKGYGLMDSKN